MAGWHRAVRRWRIVTIGLAILLPVLLALAWLLAPPALYARARAAVLHTESRYHVPTTISPEWQATLQTWTGPTAETFPAADDLEGWRALQREGARTVMRGEVLLTRYRASATPRELGGVPVLEIRPSGWQENGRVLVYVHGGAYTFNSARSTLGSSVPVADATGLRVIAIDYTLAPASRWEQTTDQVVAVFQALLAEGYAWSDIAVYGDSAGGGLAAGSVLKLRDRGLGMPAAIFLWSPWADVTDAGDTYATLAAADPLLVYRGQLERSAAAYADPANQRHPYVSPVYADFSRGFPPTLIQAGTKEIFLSNAVRLYRALDLAGIPVTLDLYEGMPHVFQGIMPRSTESQQAFEKVKRFLSQHLGQ
jgi:monoterpene epsilon-lactone hydrolase